MRYSDNVITIIESIVEQMTPVITVTATTDNGDGTIQLDACQTYWVHRGMTITYLGTDYVVSAIDVNNSITITAAADPGTGTFQLDAPVFWHGSHRKVENERKKLKDVRNPVVYLPVPTVRADNRYDSDIAYRADIRPIFLLNYLTRRDTIDLQQAEVIEPANEMADLFEQICEDDGRFEDPENMSRIEWPNFGDKTIWGNDELIFDQPLSGVELKMTLEVFMSYFCACDDGDQPITCPDVTTDFNDTPTGVDTAAGQNISFQVVNTSDVQVGTLITNSANEKKVQVNTAGLPAANQVNGSAKTDIPPGGSKNFVIQDQDSNPVTVNEVSDSDSEFVGSITIPTPKNVSNPSKTNAVALGSFATNDDADTDRGKNVNWTTLDHNNPFGNPNKFTDTLGGQTYANNIVINWDTDDQVNEKVLGIHRTAISSATGVVLLANAPYTLEGYNDWQLMNDSELQVFSNYGVYRNWLNYAPLNYDASSSANYIYLNYKDTSAAQYRFTGFGTSVVNGSTTSYPTLVVRYFTYAELGV